MYLLLQGLDGVDPKLYNPEFREKVAADTFKKLDTDKDGFVSMAEFKRGCMQNPDLAKLLTYSIL